MIAVRLENGLRVLEVVTPGVKIRAKFELKDGDRRWCPVVLVYVCEAYDLDGSAPSRVELRSIVVRGGKYVVAESHPEFAGLEEP